MEAKQRAHEAIIVIKYLSFGWFLWSIYYVGAATWQGREIVSVQKYDSSGYDTDKQDVQNFERKHKH